MIDTFNHAVWFNPVNLHHRSYFLISFSMSGHRVLPSADTHFYSATKFAVTALTEGLRQELREANTHIRVTVRFHPGCAFIPRQTTLS